MANQKQSFFNCLLDMAAMERSNNSRAGSLSIDNGNNNDGTNSQTHLLQGHHGTNEERSSLSELARRNTLRNRSLR